jgi:hypothetical protein
MIEVHPFHVLERATPISACFAAGKIVGESMSPQYLPVADSAQRHCSPSMTYCKALVLYILGPMRDIELD